MLQRQLPPTSNRLASRCDCRTPAIKLHGCVLCIQSNLWCTNLTRNIPHSLLIGLSIATRQCHLASRTQEQETCEHDVQGSDRYINGDLCGRHASQVQNARKPCRTSEIDVQHSTEIPDEAQPPWSVPLGSGWASGLHGKANPEKIKTLLEMSLPKKPKEVMSLPGRVAALSRFVLQATDNCAPFFDVLKGSKRFEWIDKCKQVF